jgi:hypothetical protein
MIGDPAALFLQHVVKRDPRAESVPAKRPHASPAALVSVWWRYKRDDEFQSYDRDRRS